MTGRRAPVITVIRTAAAALAVLLAAPGTAHGAAYKEIAVTDGGRIAGKITFTGPLPENAVEKIAINKNPEVCGTDYRNVVWVDVDEGALRGCFVFLDKMKAGKAWGAPDGGRYMIEQKGCRFRPWAQVVRQGDIYIKHSDEGVQHNINMVELIGVERGRPVERPLINRNQPAPGEAIEKVKTVRSPFIAINCQVHNFMFGFMMAPTHPYCVVVREDGTYSITDIPPGEYSLKVWHPRLGIQKTKVTVPAKGEAHADFEYTKDSKSKRRRRRSKPEPKK
ncbi:MAG: carboxypeptidase regulatory-like domain-containing protein [Planctomycetes bacterium]|nr:carboxypeptidase regulatory-like domain-containing protein [Planctomycetota bacterium]